MDTNNTQMYGAAERNQIDFCSIWFGPTLFAQACLSK